MFEIGKSYTIRMWEDGEEGDHGQRERTRNVMLRRLGAPGHSKSSAHYG